jgi:hypothetical protein
MRWKGLEFFAFSAPSACVMKRSYLFVFKSGRPSDLEFYIANPYNDVYYIRHGYVTRMQNFSKNLRAMSKFYAPEGVIWSRFHTEDPHISTRRHHTIFSCAGLAHRWYVIMFVTWVSIWFVLVQYSSHLTWTGEHTFLVFLVFRAEFVRRTIDLQIFYLLISVRCHNVYDTAVTTCTERFYIYTWGWHYNIAETCSL